MSTSFECPDLSPDLSLEEKFLVALSRLDLHPEHGSFLKELAQSGLNWARLLLLAEREGLADLVLFNLLKPEGRDLAPRIFLDSLARMRFEPRASTRAQIESGLTVLRALQEAQVTAIVLKGLPLALSYYPEPLARPMSDTDFLIREQDIGRAESVFSRLGYRPIDASISAARRNPPGTLASVDMRRDDSPHVSAHLHWHPVNSSIAVRHLVERCDLDAIWNEARTRKAKYNNRLVLLTELAPHHFLLHQAEHCLRPGHGIDRLVLLADFDRILATFGNEFDWDLTISTARAWGWESSVYIALSAARVLYRIDIPEEVLNDLKPAKPGWGERYFRRAVLSNKRRRGLSYMFHLSTQKRISQKIMFIFHTLFPPVSILTQRSGICGNRNKIALYLRRYMEIVSFLLNNINLLHRWNKDSTQN